MDRLVRGITLFFFVFLGFLSSPVCGEYYLLKEKKSLGILKEQCAGWQKPLRNPHISPSFLTYLFMFFCGVKREGIDETSQQQHGLSIFRERPRHPFAIPPALPFLVRLFSCCCPFYLQKWHVYCSEKKKKQVKGEWKMGGDRCEVWT